MRRTVVILRIGRSNRRGNGSRISIDEPAGAALHDLSRVILCKPGPIGELIGMTFYSSATMEGVQNSELELNIDRRGKNVDLSTAADEARHINDTIQPG